MPSQQPSSSLGPTLVRPPDAVEHSQPNSQRSTLGLVRHIDKWLPASLGVVLGIALAVCIASGAWQFALFVAFAAPAVVLFSGYPFTAIMIWLLLAPFVQITPTMPYRMVYWLVHRAMIPMTLVVVVINDLVVKKESTIRLGWADWAIVLSMGLVVVSILLSFPDPMPTLYEAYDRLFVPFCAYWLIYFVAPREKNLERLPPILFVIVVAEFIIGMMSWTIPQVLPVYWLKLQGVRTTGSFMGYAGYTTALTSYGLLLFYMALHQKPSLRRGIYMFAFGFSIFGVFISFSRGSWLGGAVAVLLLLFMYPKSVARVVVTILIVVAILGGGIMAQEIAWASERLADQDTAKDRLVIYHTAWLMFKEKPLLGWGYMMYDVYDRQFHSRVANHVIEDNSSHNVHLTILTERGLVGFFLYHVPLIWCLFMTLRVWSRIPKEGFWSRKLLLVLWTLVLFQIIVGNFTDTSRETFINTMWWIALGLIANMVQPYIRPDDTALPA